MAAVPLNVVRRANRRSFLDPVSPIVLDETTEKTLVGFSARGGRAPEADTWGL